jgi:hypothetical protein
MPDGPYIAHCKVPVVYKGESVADWDLQLIVSTQHLKRISYGLMLAWKKMKSSKFKVWFL